MTIKGDNIYKTMNKDGKARLKNLRRRVDRARNFPDNTCSASRCLHNIAERMATGTPYPPFQSAPEQYAEIILSVLEALWKARAEIDRSNTGLEG